METNREAYANFSVSSGCLCFGALHNIWDGASVSVQEFPTVRPRVSGTVSTHQLEYNVPAQNGIWTAFQLVDRELKRVCGWFVSYCNVDPDREIDKLLRVSGSPYEPDSGSRMNDDKTSAEGVLEINRYDWGYYDHRFREEIGDKIQEGEYDLLDISESAGLVDYAQAKSQVRAWKEQQPSERGSSEAGVWMYIPHGEYMFARFGFNDAHTAAQSFLFFTTHTVFTRTTFAGLQQPLRQEETHEEMFARRLREGYDFSGLEDLRQISVPCTVLRNTPPLPESECFGPYQRSEHVFRAEDLDALRPSGTDFQQQIEKMIWEGDVDINAPGRDSTSAEPVNLWKERVCNLLNELALSYLECFILPHNSHSAPPAAAEALFPNYTDSTAKKKLDFYLYPYFTEPHAKPIPGFHAGFVGSRIKDFLSSRSQDRSMGFDDQCIAGICRVVAFLISEVLELSINCAIDGHRTVILPIDIRISVYNDSELRDVLQYSTVFWKGESSP